MRDLIIETTTTACSVALFERGALLDYRHELIGRGHAECLLVMIAALPDGGRAERIYVGCGPGSFTGVRVGIAAACGLAQGWAAVVGGYNTLALVAATALSTAQFGLVVMAGGHGHWFVQKYAAGGKALSAVASLVPAHAIADDSDLIIGNCAEDFVEQRGYGQIIVALPDARNFMYLEEHDAGLPLAPIYGRAPDAQPTIG